MENYIEELYDFVMEFLINPLGAITLNSERDTLVTKSYKHKRTGARFMERPGYAVHKSWGLLGDLRNDFNENFKQAKKDNLVYVIVLPEDNRVQIAMDATNTLFGKMELSKSMGLQITYEDIMDEAETALIESFNKYESGELNEVRKDYDSFSIFINNHSFINIYAKRNISPKDYFFVKQFMDFYYEATKGNEKSQIAYEGVHSSDGTTI